MSVYVYALFGNGSLAAGENGMCPAVVKVEILLLSVHRIFNSGVLNRIGQQCFMGILVTLERIQ